MINYMNILQFVTSPILKPFWRRNFQNNMIGMYLNSFKLVKSLNHIVNAIYCVHVPFRLLFAISFTTMFISMWITNTAATTMMVPINFAVLKVFEDVCFFLIHFLCFYVTQTLMTKINYLQDSVLTISHSYPKSGNNF